MTRQQYLLAIGLNHHSAEIDIREQFAFPPDTISAAHRALHQLPGVLECTILTTCNRTELYLLLDSDTTSTEQILDWLHHWFKLPQRYDSHFYWHHNQQAVEHLFRVCAGLDSLVLGEPQISGQVKQALQAAQDASGDAQPIVSTILNRLFDNAFACNKTIRAQTELGQHPVTVPYASISLARQIFDDLGKSNVLLVGAGEMIALCAQHFAAQSVSNIVIANRSHARAAELVTKLSTTYPHTPVQHIRLTDIADQIAQADIIISSAASRKPLVTKAMLKNGLKQRRHRPVLAIDIAVPRNIEPQANDLNDIYLYSIDDLTTVLESNQQQRAAAASNAEAIITEHAQRFAQWLALHNASEHLQHFRHQAQQHQSHLFVQAQRELNNGQPVEQVLQQFAQRFTQRSLHGLTQTMRQAAMSGNYELLQALQSLFDAPDSASVDDNTVTHIEKHKRSSNNRQS